jgi:hypothetical protein
MCRSRSPNLVFVIALLVAVLVAGGRASPASAQGRMAVSAYAATTGVGGGVHVCALSRLHLRLSHTRLAHSHTMRYVENDLVLQGDLRGRVGGTQLQVDWYPFGGDFRLSTGLKRGGLQGSALVRAAEPFPLSETKDLAPERIGALRADVSFRRTAPYVGLGWGNVFDDRWSFLLDLGAYYAGAPRIDLHANGLITPTVRQETRAEAAVRSFRWYPNLSLGLAYRF